MIFVGVFVSRAKRYGTRNRLCAGETGVCGRAGDVVLISAVSKDDIRGELVVLNDNLITFYLALNLFYISILCYVYDCQVVRGLHVLVVVVFKGYLYHSIGLDLFSGLVVERDVYGCLCIGACLVDRLVDDVEVVFVEDVDCLKGRSFREDPSFSADLDVDTADLLLAFELRHICKRYGNDFCFVFGNGELL